jgi:hypothetical protein
VRVTAWRVVQPLDGGNAELQLQAALEQQGACPPALSGVTLLLGSLPAARLLLHELRQAQAAMAAALPSAEQAEPERATAAAED